MTGANPRQHDHDLSQKGHDSKTAKSYLKKTVESERALKCKDQRVKKKDSISNR